MSCHLLLVLLVVVVVIGCKPPGGNPSGPSGTVAMFVQVDRHIGSFTLTFGGQSISTDGDFRFDVPPGVQQVTGQLTAGPPLRNDQAAVVQIRLHGPEGQDTGRLGGPQRGTLQSIEGPNALVGECSVGYSFNGSAGQTMALRFQFNVVDSGPIGRRC